MKEIQINVDYTDKNFSAGTGEIGGVVMATHKTLEGLKKAIEEALKFHIEGCITDGDELPEWAVQGKYKIQYNLSVQALLNHFDGMITREALSKVTGINAKQLGHYMSGHRNPRADKRQKIIEGIHNIGKEFLSVV